MSGFARRSVLHVLFMTTTSTCSAKSAQSMWCVVCAACPTAVLYVVLQGPEAWHPAPPALKEAVKQCAELAADAGLSLPRLAVKAALEQAGMGVAVHLMGKCILMPLHCGK